MDEHNRIPAIEVANFFIEASEGSYSQLKLQKLIYIANLIHYAEFKQFLVKENFEAWDYGPVIPSLYHKLKENGRLCIPDKLKIDNNSKLSETQKNLLAKVNENFGKLPPSVLVSITHMKDGAWDKCYIPRASIDIPESHIADEANKLVAIIGR